MAVYQNRPYILKSFIKHKLHEVICVGPPSERDYGLARGEVESSQQDEFPPNCYMVKKRAQRAVLAPWVASVDSSAVHGISQL